MKKSSSGKVAAPKAYEDVKYLTTSAGSTVTNNTLVYDQEQSLYGTVWNNLIEHTQIVCPDWVRHEGGTINSLHVHPNGERLVTVSDNGFLNIWNTSSIYDIGAQTNPLVTNNTLSIGIGISCNTVRFSPDGFYLAAGGDDGKVYLYRQTPEAHQEMGQETSLESWTLCHVLSKHTSSVNDLAWSPNSQMLATCSVDNLVILWSVPSPTIDRVTGQVLTTNFTSITPFVIAICEGHTSWVTGIAFDPLGVYIASQDIMGVVIIWRFSKTLRDGVEIDTVKKTTSFYAYISPSTVNQNPLTKPASDEAAIAPKQTKSRKRGRASSAAQIDSTATPEDKLTLKPAKASKRGNAKLGSQRQNPSQQSEYQTGINTLNTKSSYSRLSFSPDGSYLLTSRGTNSLGMDLLPQHSVDEGTPPTCISCQFQRETWRIVNQYVCGYTATTVTSYNPQLFDAVLAPTQPGDMSQEPTPTTHPSAAKRTPRTPRALSPTSPSQGDSEPAHGTMPPKYPRFFNPSLALPPSVDISSVRHTSSLLVDKPDAMEDSSIPLKTHTYSLFAMGSIDGTVSLWSTTSSYPIFVIPSATNQPVTDLSWSLDGHALYISFFGYINVVRFGFYDCGLIKPYNVLYDSVLKAAQRQLNTTVLSRFDRNYSGIDSPLRTLVEDDTPPLGSTNRQSHADSTHHLLASGHPSSSSSPSTHSPASAESSSTATSQPQSSTASASVFSSLQAIQSRVDERVHVLLRPTEAGIIGTYIGNLVNSFLHTFMLDMIYRRECSELAVFAAAPYYDDPNDPHLADNDSGDDEMNDNSADDDHSEDHGSDKHSNTKRTDTSLVLFESDSDSDHPSDSGAASHRASPAPDDSHGDDDPIDFITPAVSTRTAQNSLLLQEYVWSIWSYLDRFLQCESQHYKASSGRSAIPIAKGTSSQLPFAPITFDDIIFMREERRGITLAIDLDLMRDAKNNFNPDFNLAFYGRCYHNTREEVEVNVLSVRSKKTGEVISSGEKIDGGAINPQSIDSTSSTSGSGDAKVHDLETGSKSAQSTGSSTTDIALPPTERSVDHKTLEDSLIAALTALKQEMSAGYHLTKQSQLESLISSVFNEHHTGDEATSLANTPSSMLHRPQQARLLKQLRDQLASQQEIHQYEMDQLKNLSSERAMSKQTTQSSRHFALPEPEYPFVLAPQLNTHKSTSSGNGPLVYSFDRSISMPIHSVSRIPWCVSHQVSPYTESSNATLYIDARTTILFDEPKGLHGTALLSPRHITTSHHLFSSGRLSDSNTNITISLSMPSSSFPSQPIVLSHLSEHGHLIILERLNDDYFAFVVRQLGAPTTPPQFKLSLFHIPSLQCVLSLLLPSCPYSLSVPVTNFNAQVPSTSHVFALTFCTGEIWVCHLQSLSVSKTDISQLLPLVPQTPTQQITPHVSSPRTLGTPGEDEEQQSTSPTSLPSGGISNTLPVIHCYSDSLIVVANSTYSIFYHKAGANLSRSQSHTNTTTTTEPQADTKPLGSPSASLGEHEWNAVSLPRPARLPMFRVSTILSSKSEPHLLWLYRLVTMEEPLWLQVSCLGLSNSTTGIASPRTPSSTPGTRTQQDSFALFTLLVYEFIEFIEKQVILIYLHQRDTGLVKYFRGLFKYVRILLMFLGYLKRLGAGDSSIPHSPAATSDPSVRETNHPQIECLFQLFLHRLTQIVLCFGTTANQQDEKMDTTRQQHDKDLPANLAVLSQTSPVFGRYHYQLEEATKKLSDVQRQHVWSTTLSLVVNSDVQQCQALAQYLQ